MVSIKKLIKVRINIDQVDVLIKNFHIKEKEIGDSFTKY